MVGIHEAIVKAAATAKVTENVGFNANSLFGIAEQIIKEEYEQTAV